MYLLRCLWIGMFLWGGTVHVMAQEDPLQQALDQLQTAKQQRDRPALIRSHIRLGKLYEQRFDPRQAYEQYELALQLVDSSAKTMARWTFLKQSLGDNAFNLGDFPLALRHYRSVESIYRNGGDCDNLVSQFSRIARVYNNQGRYDEAITYYQEAIEAFEFAQIDPHVHIDSLGLAILLTGLGIAYTKQSEYETALTYYLQVVDIYSTLPYPDNLKNLQYTYINIGGTLTSMLNYAKSLEYLQKALAISEEFGPAHLVAVGYNNIGRNFLLQQSYEEALHYFKLSRQFAEEQKNTDQLARTSFNIGQVYEGLEKSDQALESYQSALKQWQEVANHSGVSMIHLKIAELEMKQEAYDEAKEHLQQAATLQKTVGDSRAQAQIMTALGNLANVKKKYSRAEVLCKNALDLVQADRHFREIEKSCECLIQAYQGMRNYQQVAMYQEIFIQVRDSLLNEEKIKEFTRLDMQYQFDKEKEQIKLAQQQEEQRLQADIDRQNLLRNYLIGGLLLGAFVIILLWRAYRINQQKNRLLASQKSIIQTSLEEKDTLLREIHHRVKNNLQVVSSLLSIQSRTIEDPVALDAIQEGRNRVKAMALIHQNLYQEENLIGVDLPAYIQKLTDSLVSSYKVDTNQIQLKREIAPISLDVDTIIPLGLILNELISNALKYAFPEQEEGEIQLSIDEKEAGIEITVQDNGIGLPEDFQVEGSQSMGFKLVQSFVKKMNASFQIDSQGGTKIHILLPGVVGA